MGADKRGSSADVFLRGNARGSTKNVRGNLCVVFEAPGRKEMRKFGRKTFAETAAEGLRGKCISVVKQHTNAK